jgi:hypothetical protein
MEPVIKLPFILDVATQLLKEKILKTQKLDEQNDINLLIQNIEDGNINIYFNDINFCIFESYDVQKYKITLCEFNSNIVEDYILYGKINTSLKIKLKQFINPTIIQTTITNIFIKDNDIFLHKN